MVKYTTTQSYDVVDKDKNLYGRFHSIPEARKKAMQMCYNNKIFIYKNPKVNPDGTIRPRELFITVTCVQFIRPKYDYKYFGKEFTHSNGKPVTKYYLIGKNGEISITDSSFQRYFDPTFKNSGVWNRPKKTPHPFGL